MNMLNISLRNRFMDDYRSFKYNTLNPERTRRKPRAVPNTYLNAGLEYDDMGYFATTDDVLYIQICGI
jgi:hypothetical protein